VAAIALCALALATGCDNRQQKPKVIALVSEAAAQTTGARPQRLFERHVIDGKDPQLKRYAEHTLGALREHLTAVHKLVNAIAGR
jgi:hypothetical protein